MELFVFGEATEGRVAFAAAIALVSGHTGTQSGRVVARTGRYVYVEGQAAALRVGFVKINIVLVQLIVWLHFSRIGRLGVTCLF